MNTYYKKFIPYLFLLPAVVLLGVFFFLPFIQTLVMSLKDYSIDIYNPTWAGLSNYYSLLNSKEFYTSLTNTFLFLILVVPFLAIFPLIVAIFINQKIKGISIYKVLIYLPVVVSIVVVAIAFKWLYAQEGILNYFMQLIGLNAIGWLTDTKFAMLSVAIVTIYYSSDWKKRTKNTNYDTFN